MTYERLLISVREAATLLGISESTAYRLAREDRIPVVRIGASVKVNRRQLELWIEQHTGRAA